MDISDSIFDRTKLKREDLYYLNQMLKSDMPLDDCLKLLKNRRNGEILSSISEALKKGHLIEEILPVHVPKRIGDYLIPFLKTLSFKDALNLSLLMDEKHSEYKRKLLENTAYPFILLFISVTALYFFDLYGLDSVFSLLLDFKMNLTVFTGIRIILRIAVRLFYFGFLFFTAAFMYFTSEKRIRLFYLFLAGHFKGGIIKRYYCGELVSLLLICEKMGFKTKDALKLLISLHSKAVISLLAWHLDEALTKGLSLKDASSQIYFDPLLSDYISMGSYTGEYLSLLENYVSLNEMKLKREMKALTLIIQIAVYVFIGGVIIFVYQVLFLPMQALLNI